MKKQLLKAHEDSFPLSRYEDAVTRLSHDTNNRAAQYQAVLSLARMGSTVFALQEYERYGLDNERESEDIIALKGRLFKDLSLQAKTDDAQKFALKSAQYYDLAYQRTKGFFSGINAATMFFLADKTDPQYQRRAQKILRDLSDIEPSSARDYYFIEATRAEAHLLLDDEDRTKQRFKNALSHDPLNYMAHAATLKQFGFIQAHKNLKTDWLLEFRPPKPVHFGGHIWHENSIPSEENLRSQFSDIIQKYDFGFAYGALAAGADIFMAEGFLAEGIPLHLVLPDSIEAFCQKSVAPFGPTWIKRFEHCLDQSVSVTCLPTQKSEPSDEAIKFAAEVSMGQTILRARSFALPPAQCLLLDDLRGSSMSHDLKKIWHRAGFETIIQPVQLEDQTKSKGLTGEGSIKWALLTVENSPIIFASERDSLFDQIIEIRRDYPEQALFFDYYAHMGESDINDLLTKSDPSTIFLSEFAAAHLTLYNTALTGITYAGILTCDAASSPMHIYSLALSY